MGLRFNFKLKTARELFFDREVVRAMIDADTRRVLSRFGYFTMRDARQSIRHRKRSSRPGQPPTSWSDILKLSIVFFYDDTVRSVIVGPTGSPDSDIPQALEFGLPCYNARARKRVKVGARPYMRPAAERQLLKLPQAWKSNLAPQGNASAYRMNPLAVRAYLRANTR